MKNLFDIVSHFEIQGTISDIKPLGCGINQRHLQSNYGRNRCP